MTDTRHGVVLVGAFLVSIGANAFFIAPSSIGPLLLDEFTVSTGAIGSTVSAALLGAVVTQLPAGLLMDRYDNRLLVLAGLVGFGLVALVLQAESDFRTFLGLRLLGGILASLLFVVGANVVAEVFPDATTSVGTGIYLASPPTAFAFAHVTGPVVARAFGPRTVFLTHLALAIPGAAVLALGASGPIQSGAAPTLADVRAALANRAVLLVSLSTFSVYALYVFLNTWIPTYATDVLLLPLRVGGLVTALVPLAGILARPGGGWASTRLGNRRRPVLVAGLLSGMVLVVAIPFTSGFTVFVLVVTAAAFGVQLGTGVYYVFTRELATPGTEGTSLTVLTTVAFTGAFLAPLAGGWLITAYSWSHAFAVVASLGVLGILALVPVSEPA